MSVLEKAKLLPLVAIISAILIGCGGGGGGSDSDTTTNNQNPDTTQTNTPPTVTVEDKEVTSNSNVSITATASDADGTIASYQWEQLSGSAVEMQGEQTNSLTFSAPDVTSEQTLTFRVSVTDDDDATASATSTITVTPTSQVNTPPTVAVESKEVTSNSNVSITATASDADGTIASYQWEQLSGSAVEMQGEQTNSLTFAAPDVTSEQTLTFRVSVTDDDDATASATSTITVTPTSQVNTPPTVAVESKEVTSNSNVSITATASDADGTIASYQWEQLSGSAVEMQGEQTNSLTFAAPDVTSEQTLTFRVSVTDDDDATASATSTITVTPTSQVNTPPTVAVESKEVTSNSNVSITATASDADGTIASYQWEQLSGSAVEMQGEHTNSLTFAAPDVTNEQTLTFRVSVTDDDDATASATSTITVTPEEIPTLTINGKVSIDAETPIANAQVTIFSADTPIETATANNQGEYSIEIPIENENQLLRLEATPNDPSSKIKLTSLIGSLNSAVEKSGEDKILIPSEFFNVNITSLTTAFDALIKNTAESTIENDDQYSEAARLIDPQQISPKAIAISLVNKNLATLPLPSDVSNTQDLVADTEQVNDYVEKAKLVAPDDYAQSYQSFFSTTPNTIHTTDFVVGLDKYLLNSNSNEDIPAIRFDLSENNDGHIYESFFNSPFEWTEEQNRIVINYPNGGVPTSRTTRNIDGNDQPVVTYRTQTIITPILVHSEVTHVYVSHNTFESFPDSNIENTEVSIQQPLFYKMISQSDIVTPSTVLKPDTDYYFNFNSTSPFSDESDNEPYNDYPNDDIVKSEFTLLHLNLGNDMFVTVKNYSIGSDNDIDFTAVAGQYEFSDENTFLFGGIGPQGDIANFVFSFFNTESPASFHATASGMGQGFTFTFDFSEMILEDKVDSWPTSDIVGIYSLKSDRDTPLKHAWVELTNDNTAKTFFSEDENNDGKLSNSEIIEFDGKWQLEGDDKVKIRRYKYKLGHTDEGKNCIPASFTPSLNEDCITWHEREISPLQIVNNQSYYFVHTHKFYDVFSSPIDENSQVRNYHASYDIRKWEKLSKYPVVIPQTDN